MGPGGMPVVGTLAASDPFSHQRLEVEEAVMGYVLLVGILAAAWVGGCYWIVTRIPPRRTYE